jgi:nitrogenase molybdenum-iron protein NifN
MAEILKRAKPLAVNPLKASQPIGAALAFLGLRRAIPMLHGSQGCTAFGKVFLVRHFREPIPLQTTAMDQVSSIMSADENVIEGLRVLCEKNSPELIGLPTTGLVRNAGLRHPAAGARIPRSPSGVRGDRGGAGEHAGLSGLPRIRFCPGGRSDHRHAGPGHHAARHWSGARRKQVNVLASSMLTPGDIEAIKTWIEAFGLRRWCCPISVIRSTGI